MAQGQKEKLTVVVGCPLSIEQDQRLQFIINQHAPGMPKGRLLRMTFLLFLEQLNQQGPLPFLADRLGA